MTDVENSLIFVENQGMGLFGQDIVGDGRAARTTDPPVVVAERVDKLWVRILPRSVAAHVH